MDRTYGNDKFSVYVLHVFLDGTRILDQGVRILTDQHGRSVLARLSLDEAYLISNAVSLTPADAEAAVRRDLEAMAGAVRADVFVHPAPVLHGENGSYLFAYQADAVCAGPDEICGPFEYRIDAGSGRVLEKRPRYYNDIDCDLSDYDLDGFGSVRVYDTSTVGQTVDLFQRTDPYASGTHFYSKMRFISQQVDPPYWYVTSELGGCPVDEVCYDFTGWANSCFVFSCDELSSTWLRCPIVDGWCWCRDFPDAEFFYPGEGWDNEKRRMLITAFQQIQRLVFAVLEHFPTGVPLLNNQVGSTPFDDVFDLYINELGVGVLGSFSSLWGCDDSIRLDPDFFARHYLTTPIHESCHSIQEYYFGGYDKNHFIDSVVGEAIPTVFASFLNGYSYGRLEKQLGCTSVQYCRQKFYSLLRDYVPENSFDDDDYRNRSWNDCRYAGNEWGCSNFCATNQRIEGCEYYFDCTYPGGFEVGFTEPCRSLPQHWLNSEKLPATKTYFSKYCSQAC